MVGGFEDNVPAGTCRTWAQRVELCRLGKVYLRTESENLRCESREGNLESSKNSNVCYKKSKCSFGLSWLPVDGGRALLSNDIIWVAAERNQHILQNMLFEKFPKNHQRNIFRTFNAFIFYFIFNAISDFSSSDNFDILTLKLKKLLTIF